ncbi:YkvA family protein [Limimaricola soesokkakensis]|uniref:YkvA family protein n=1 Tax=Limimaricola soesokkakensis TaxID=1343159 RepID=UPI003514ED03
MRLKKVSSWARNLKRDVVALWIASRDRRTPLAAKLVAGAVAAYALSPIDLIPDVIPVLGQLDDLLIVPLGIMLALRLIPAPLMREFREAALLRSRPRSPIAAAAVIGIWTLGAAVLAMIWLKQEP